MKHRNKDRLIGRGLYLAYWPNGSFSVVHYKSRARLSDLFRDLDAFGSPLDAKVIFFCGDVAIDFEVSERRGRRVVRKSVADRGNVRWIKLPSNIAELCLLMDAGCA